ncbi:DNA polymerase/3'-5' exonuclease PolX [ANME-1 cluster archaeon AG-394-G06]|nr:DNA polymerase/3'-5' exonuclease PolX [ANME-1 cluster archaeon AG-394-G06]
MINLDMARIFDEIADIFEVKGENPFKIRAYRRAARTIESLTQDLKVIAERGGVSELKKIPGVGEGIAKKIVEIAQTGDCKKHRELTQEVPSGVLELLAIPRVGPKTIAKVHDELGIGSIADLEEAAKSHKLEKLPGLGAKVEENILKGIAQYRSYKGRVLLSEALPRAESIVTELKKLDAVAKITIAGSLRRMRETIGDIDILVVSNRPRAVMDAFTCLDGVEDIVAKGDTKSSILLRGINVDLRVVDEASFGAAAHYFTGSKHHNIRIRELGMKQGLKINEYGIFRGDERIGGEDEADVFASVGLAYIPPELREDRGEIEAAKANRIPELVAANDIKGDLHVHTNWSDGKNSIEEMALTAISSGYEYIAVADHSPAVGIAGGMNEDKITKREVEIEKVNKRFEDEGTNFKVLSASEVDIKSDFSMDFPDDVLKSLDVVVGAIHTKFTQDRETMTKRIVTAMENPNVDIIAHPTGRLLGKRDPYEVDMEQLMESAKATGTVMELNSFPGRLDLNDVHCKMAKDYGVLIAISTDAHDAMQMRDVIKYGVATARRGWLEPKDVVNTRGLEDVMNVMKR